MPRNWIGLAEASNGDYEVEDFQRALYQLNAEQCLYARFPHQSVAYRLISRYRVEFTEAALLSGNVLEFRDRQEYCYITNSVAKLSQMTLAETTFALTLRYGYHVHASAGNLSELGEAVIELPELAEMHKAVSGRELDLAARNLDSLMALARRSGLARKEETPEGDPQPYAVAVLPGIADVLGEHVVGRFGAQIKARIVGAKADALLMASNDAAQTASATEVQGHGQVMQTTSQTSENNQAEQAQD